VTWKDDTTHISKRTDIEEMTACLAQI
jgi:hypothetical protein